LVGRVSLGDTGKEMESAKKGIERARAILDLNPDDNRALNMGAFALLRLGEKEEAAGMMIFGLFVFAFMMVIFLI